jgi:predicted house-cleaning noncanonical NTP pyrophosphatase (MazG superfamily)
MEKLVRDKMPQIIREKGDKINTRVATKKEFWEKLKEKLKEEVSDYVRTENEEELADIYEVLNEIYKIKGLNKKKLAKIREDKIKIKGKYKKRIILEK